MRCLLIKPFSAAVRRILAMAIAGVALSMCPCPAVGQAHAPASARGPLDVPPAQWIQAATHNEIQIIDDDGNFPLRYRIHKIDPKGDVVREVIESRDGTVAREIERNGKPLTSSEDQAERERLTTLLASPSDFAAHHKKDTTSRNYSKDLLRDFPAAMLFTYTAGQPQSRAGLPPEVVIDFVPNPAYKPPTLVDDSLTGISGRLWIDAATQRVLRIEIVFRHAVDYGWGVLARIYAGGTVEFEQTPIGEHRWSYSHLISHLKIRELLFKTTQENISMDYAGFQLLPHPVSWQDAVHMLLAEHVVTQ